MSKNIDFWWLVNSNCYIKIRESKILNSTKIKTNNKFIGFSLLFICGYQLTMNKKYIYTSKDTQGVHLPDIVSSTGKVYSHLAQL